MDKKKLETKILLPDFEILKEHVQFSISSWFETKKKGLFKGAQMPQNSIKNSFLVVSDYFSYKNGPIDLVRGLYSSLDIATNNLPICTPFSTFWGPFGGAKMPQNSIESYFLVVSDYFSYKNGPIDLVRVLFLSLDTGTYIPPTCGPLSTILGPIGGAQMPQNSINTHFLVVLDHFSYKNGLIDLVRSPFSNLDTGTYIWPTCGSVCTFLGPFGGAQMPQNRIKKTIFWLFWTISPTRIGLLIRLGAYFQA
jgi:hypothetical protein